MDAVRYAFAAALVLAATYGAVRASWHATHGPTRPTPPPDAGAVFSGRRQAAIVLTVLLVAVILAAFAT